MITCSFCTPRDANWQSRANFLMPVFLSWRKMQEWKRRLERASGCSQRSWSRSGVWMEEMEWKRLELPEGLQRAEGRDPAGGRRRTAPSHSGRKTALIPGSHLSSLVGIRGDSRSSKLFIFRGIPAGAGCPPARDATEGNLTVCEKG